MARLRPERETETVKGAETWQSTVVLSSEVVVNHVGSKVHDRQWLNCESAMNTVLRVAPQRKVRHLGNTSLSVQELD